MIPNYSTIVKTRTGEDINVEPLIDLLEQLQVTPATLANRLDEFAFLSLQIASSSSLATQGPEIQNMQHCLVQLRNAFQNMKVAA